MYAFNPIALRMAKIVYNFGLSECNRVKAYHNAYFYEEIQTLILKLSIIPSYLEHCNHHPMFIIPISNS